MKTDRQSRWARWRALCAALCLLFGVVSAPVALAGSSAGDVCTMACCVEQGRCCCKPRHAFVEGQVNDGKPRIAETEVAAPCPADCAGFSASSPSFTREAPGPAGHCMDDLAAPAAHLPLLVGKSLATANDTSAPRAPPARLLHSAN
ncbi:MAG TPA: hypothetical protein VJZ91_03900 [Blastocatellia bacterium]|nr:hypothetical protein [Blastocatellia bacterium]